MDDLLNEFLTETTESMDTLDVELVKLQQNLNDPELLSIFSVLCIRSRVPAGSSGCLACNRLRMPARTSLARSVTVTLRLRRMPCRWFCNAWIR